MVTIKTGKIEEATLDRFGLGVIAVVTFLSRFLTLNQPLLERHDFRQTQTAYQALSFVNGDGSLMRPHLPIFGSPWELPFEFPLFQLLVSYVHRLTSMSIDTASRSTALFFFVLCSVPLFNLARKLISRLASYCVVVIFCFSPFAFQWSRASLIEYCAVFFGLVFVNLIIKIWHQSDLRSLALASISGSICGLVKVTTFVPMTIFVILICSLHFGSLSESFKKKRNLALIAIPISISLGIARLWTIWSDHIRVQNPATKWLSEKSLSSWTYGTVQQRLSLENWQIIFDRIDKLILGHFTWVAVIVIALFVRNSMVKALAIFISVSATIFIFFNLYVIHDYYLIAVSALLALQIGIAVDDATKFLLDRKKKLALPLVPIVFLLLLPDSFDPKTSYWGLSYRELRQPTSELSVLSNREQYAFTSFEGWNPRLLYYANRKGMMLDSRATNLSYLQTLSDLEKYDFYAGVPDRPDVVQLRGWYLPVGESTTRIDDNAFAFNQWGVVIGAANLRDQEKLKNEQILKCDGVEKLSLTKFPIGSTLSTSGGGPGYFLFSPVLQPVPIGGQIKILGTIRPLKYSQLSCTGVNSIIIRW